MQFDNMNLENKLDLYEKGFKSLKTFLESLPIDVLLFSPDKNHWTTKEIAIHLTDTEGIYFVRFRRAISESGSDLLTFDNDHWAKDLQYISRDLNFNLQLLDYMRQSNASILRSIPDHYWQEKQYKVEEELFPLEKLLERNLNHFYGHLEVIKKRYDQYKEQV
jgi:hypothetical protein